MLQEAKVRCGAAPSLSLLCLAYADPAPAGQAQGGAEFYSAKAGVAASLDAALKHLGLARLPPLVVRQPSPALLPTHTLLIA